MEVHHKNYDHVKADIGIFEEDIENDLITLCHACHMAEHERLRLEKEAEEEKRREILAQPNGGMILQYLEETTKTSKPKFNYYSKFYQWVETNHKDIIDGGPYKMTNRDDIKRAYEEFIGHEIERVYSVTSIISHFRNNRIRLILDIMNGGGSPDDALAKGISYNIVHKYWGDPEHANFILTLDE